MWRRMRFNNLKFELGQDPGLNNNFKQLRSNFKGILDNDIIQKTDTVEKLLDELEEKGVVHIYKTAPFKELLGIVERPDLLKKVIEFEKQRDEHTVSLQEYAYSLTVKGKQLKRGAVSLVKTVVGALGLKVTLKTGVYMVDACVTGYILTRFPESYDEFDRIVLKDLREIALKEVTIGCLCFTVQAKDVSALRALWELCQKGTLKDRLQEFLVTEKVKQLANSEEVEVYVTIDEQEYKDACLDLMAARIQDQEIQEEEKQTGLTRRWCSESDVSDYEEMSFLLRSTQPLVEEMQRQEMIFQEIPRVDFESDVSDYEAKAEETPLLLRSTQPLVDEMEKQEMVVQVPTDEPRFKDLTDETLEEVSKGLKADERAWETFLRVSGIKDFGEDQTPKRVFRSYPDATIASFKAILEALELDEVVELLEGVKPRVPSSLKFDWSVDEMEKLRKTDDRRVTYHSSAAVLMFENNKNKDATKKIKEFFLELNPKNMVKVVNVDGNEVSDIWKRRNDMRRALSEMEYPLDRVKFALKKMEGALKGKVGLKEVEKGEVGLKELKRENLGMKGLESEELRLKELERKMMAVKKMESRQLRLKELETKAMAIRKIEKWELERMERKVPKNMERKMMAIKELEFEELTLLQELEEEMMRITRFEGRGLEMAELMRPREELIRPREELKREELKREKGNFMLSIKELLVGVESLLEYVKLRLYEVEMFLEGGEMSVMGRDVWPGMGFLRIHWMDLNSRIRKLSMYSSDEAEVSEVQQDVVKLNERKEMAMMKAEMIRTKLDQVKSRLMGIINEDVEKLKTDVSGTLDEWSRHQERFDFFAVLDFAMKGHEERRVREEGVFKMQKSLPGKAKVLVHSMVRGDGMSLPISDFLCVTFETGGELGEDELPEDELPKCVYKIFNKRWQTRDILSMMLELRRTVYAQHSKDTGIEDHLSSRVRFQKL